MKLNNISRINKLIDFSSRSYSLNHNSIIKFFIDRINIDICAKFTHSNNGPRFKESLPSLKSYSKINIRGGL